MSLNALLALRSRLSTDAALNAFWQTHYQKQARHLVGYRRSPSANDYPSICYVPTRTRLKQIRNDQTSVSLIIGVNDPEITDDVFNGIIRLDEALELILIALDPLRLSANSVIYANESMVINDINGRHPFHELELQLTIKIYQ